MPRKLLQVILVTIAGIALGGMVYQSGKILQPERRQTQASKAIRRDTTLRITRFEVELRYPKGTPRGTLLLLPGWDFSRRYWCDSTALCDSALNARWVVVLPEMRRSLYASARFPETRADLAAEPDLLWLRDTAFKRLADTFGLLKPGANNYVVGLSTGARGVAQLLTTDPNRFTAACALSGDYDQTLQPTDNLMRLYYGPYVRFAQRWQMVDNPGRKTQQMRTPLYLAHGAQDKLVPALHSDTLFARLRRTGHAVEYHKPAKAGHDFRFWRSEVPRMMRFLRQHTSE